MATSSITTAAAAAASTASAPTATAAPAGPVAQIKLRSSDGKVLTVDRALAKHMVTINNLLQDVSDSKDDAPEIPVPTVDGQTLNNVIKYLTLHKDTGFAEAEQADDDEEQAYDSDDIEPADQKFVDELEQPELFALILAANFLEIKPLLTLGCKVVANLIKACKTVEEIRTKFGIQNDFTPEEEEQVKRENQWCEDPSRLST